MDLRRYSKFFVALGAAIGVLIAALNDPATPGVIDGADFIEVLLAFLGAIGVYAVKNEQ